MKVEIVDRHNAPVSLVDGAFVLEECRRYRIRAPGASEVWLGEQTLKLGSSGSATVALDHAVGELELRATSPEGVDARYRIRVIPRREKLPPESWVNLLQELEEGLSGLSVGVMGPGVGAVGTGGISAPLLVSALLPLLPALVRALQAILDGPRHVEDEHESERKLHECRRIDSSTLSWISRHPEVGRWLDGWRAVELVEPPPRVPVVASVSTLDHPVNRYVAWLTRRVIEQLDAVAVRLDEIAAKVEDPSWCRARAKRARAGADRIRRLRDRSWLRGIRSEPATEAALLVVTDEPGYARFHRFARRFCAPAFRLADSAEDPRAAVRPSFSIYELWCFFAVRRLLAARLPDWRWTAERLENLRTGTGRGARFVATRGDQRLAIEFNPTFRSWYTRKDRARHSLSGTRRPDIVITLDDGHGQGGWLVLDAKYRAGRENLADALASAHIYRDSLRDTGRGGRCTGAMLLVPGPCDVADWVDPTWHEREGQGITSLAPGSDAPALIAWILAQLAIR